MRTIAKPQANGEGVMGQVRQRIERAGERLWRLDDFADYPFNAVAQALSRLTREGTVERDSAKGYTIAIGKQRSAKVIRTRPLYKS